MKLAWELERVTVKDVLSRLGRERAYNTVQTTLDRLFRKGLLLREKQGHAFAYSCRMSRAEYQRALISSVVGDLSTNRAPMLAAFVDVVADADRENLNRLEKLIQAKRAAKRKK